MEGAGETLRRSKEGTLEDLGRVLKGPREDLGRALEGVREDQARALARPWKVLGSSPSAEENVGEESKRSSEGPSKMLLKT